MPSQTNASELRFPATVSEYCPNTHIRHQLIAQIQDMPPESQHTDVRRKECDTGLLSILKDTASNAVCVAATGPPTYMRAIRMGCATVDIGKPLLVAVP